MEFDCPLRLCCRTVDAVVVVGRRPPDADKAVVDFVWTPVVGKLVSVAADTVAVGWMVQAAVLG